MLVNGKADCPDLCSECILEMNLANNCFPQVFYVDVAFVCRYKAGNEFSIILMNLFLHIPQELKISKDP